MQCSERDFLWLGAGWSEEKWCNSRNRLFYELSAKKQKMDTDGLYLLSGSLADHLCRRSQRLPVYQFDNLNIMQHIGYPFLGSGFWELFWISQNPQRSRAVSFTNTMNNTTIVSIALHRSAYVKQSNFKLKIINLFDSTSFDLFLKSCNTGLWGRFFCSVFCELFGIHRAVLWIVFEFTEQKEVTLHHQNTTEIKRTNCYEHKRTSNWRLVCESKARLGQGQACEATRLTSDVTAFTKARRWQRWAGSLHREYLQSLGTQNVPRWQSTIKRTIK
jgi:hypothetical protein